MKITNELKVLKIRKSLPQILIPSNKIEMLIDWWNKDIRFQNDIPHSFEEGYVIINNNIMNYDSINANNLIKNLAKQLNTTYRVIEQRWEEFKTLTKNVTLYFKFDGNKCGILIYDIKGQLFTTLDFTYGAEGGKRSITMFEESPIDLNTTFNDNLQNYQDYFNIICLSLFTTSMWYIATSTKQTRYIYNRPNETIPNKDRDVKSVKRVKVINTPVYDMNKIRVVETDRLIQRRKGWTYSHSFQVHGHYRHYKDGKTIFINSYIKGKDKPLQSQQFVVAPKNL